jgi:ABC-type antimicrobial peptide transport system permease subunit
MKLEKSLNLLLFKCFVRIGKIVPIIISAAFLCSLLISGTWSIYSSSKIRRLDDANALFGNYQVLVNDIPSELAQRIISKESSIVDSTIYLQRIFQNEKGIENCIYANSDYFALSCASLKFGAFPIAKNEVLVDDLYVYESGYDREIIGRSIAINGTEYKIVGVITNSDFNIAGIVSHTYIFSYNSLSEAEPCSFLAKTSSINFSGLVNNMRSIYHIDSNQVNVNNNVLDYVGIDTSGVPTGLEATIFRIIVCFIGILSSFLLYTLVMMFIRKLNPITSICTALGVNFKKLVVFSFTFVGSIISICFLLANIISVSLVSRIFSINYISFFDESNLLPLVILFSSFLCIMFISIISTVPKNSKRIIDNVNNSYRVKYAKNKKLSEKRHSFLFLSLAKQNLIVVKSKMLIFVSIIVFSGILFSVSSYLLNVFQESTAPMSGFDYELEFKYNNQEEMYLGTKSHELLYKKIDKTFSETKYPVFYYPTYAGFDKRSISKDHSKFLEQLGTDYSIILNNPSSTRINVPVIVMFAEENVMQRFGAKPEEIIDINENECLVVTNTIPFMGSNFSVGISVGNSITLDLLEDDRKETEITTAKPLLNIKVAGTIDSLNLDLDVIKNVPLILLNKSTFDRIVPNHSYPTYVLFDKTVSDSQGIKNFFKRIPGIQLTDLTEANETSRNYFSLLQYSISSVLITLVVFLALIMTLTTYLRYEESKNQYAVLRAIGVDAHRVIRIFMYEAGFVSAISTILIIPLSVLGSYVVYNILARNTLFFFFQIPYIAISIPIVAFAIISLVAYLPAIVKMQREAIANVLKYD